jgi:hypothetical protein
MSYKDVVASLNTLLIKASTATETRIGMSEAIVAFLQVRGRLLLLSLGCFDFPTPSPDPHSNQRVSLSPLTFFPLSPPHPPPQAMGATFVEKHSAELLQGLLAILEQSKATSSPADALGLRRCLHFVIIDAMGRRLGQKGRQDTLNTLITIVNKGMAAATRENATAPSEGATQTTLLALEVAAEQVIILGNACNAFFDTMLPALLDASLHPAAGVRIAAAHALRNLVEVVPARAASVVSTCLTRLGNFRSSAVALNGTGACLAAALAASVPASLGLPQDLCQRCFVAGMDFTDSATAPKDSAQALVRLDVGWWILSALVGMGAATLAPHLTRIVERWRAVLVAPQPKKAGAKVSVTRWRHVIAEFYGALSSMQLFLRFCPELVTEDAQRTVAQLVCGLLDVIPQIPAPAKSTLMLVEPAAALRARLFATLAMLPLSLLEERFPALLPLLVADFALSENPSAVTTTSLLRAQCHEEDSVLIGATSKSDYDFIEAQLSVHGGAGLGEVSNDILYIIRPDTNLTSPMPLPPLVAAVDESTLLFGKVRNVVRRPASAACWVPTAVAPAHLSHLHTGRSSRFWARTSIATSSCSILSRSSGQPRGLSGGRRYR